MAADSGRYGSTAATAVPVVDVTDSSDVARRPVAVARRTALAVGRTGCGQQPGVSAAPVVRVVGTEVVGVAGAATATAGEGCGQATKPYFDGVAAGSTIVTGGLGRASGVSSDLDGRSGGLPGRSP